MILKSDKPNELADPLKENILPKFAIKLGITHHSPTQATQPDGSWLFKYLFLTQEQRRSLPSNAQMKAGVAVNNILQKFYADTIWNFGPQRKLQPNKNILKGKTKEELITSEVDEYKLYVPNDEKDRSKFEKYQAEIVEVSNHGFSALENIVGADLGPIVCEEQISITQDFSSLLCPVVGRTDFTFSGVSSNASGQGSSDRSFPSLIVELKTSWSKLGKLKKDGTRSFIVSSLPSAPSYTHLLQCSYYAAKYDFKVPVKLVYLTVKGHQTFSQDNCIDLTPDALRRHFNNMCNIFRRRELILSQFEDEDKYNIISKAAEIVDPNFDHPWCWFGMPKEFMDEARKLWRIS